MSDGATRRGFLAALAAMATAPLATAAPTGRAVYEVTTSLGGMVVARYRYCAPVAKIFVDCSARLEPASTVRLGRGVEEWSPRLAHNQQNAGSNPAPATNLEPGP